MVKIDELVDKPDNLRFLNNKARAYWTLHYGTQKDLVLVQGRDVDQQIMTQEAYNLLIEGLGTDHGTVPAKVDPSTAAWLVSWVWTREDVEVYLNRHPEPKDGA